MRLSMEGHWQALLGRGTVSLQGALAQLGWWSRPSGVLGIAGACRQPWTCCTISVVKIPGCHVGQTLFAPWLPGCQCSRTQEPPWSGFLEPLRHAAAKDALSCPSLSASPWG